MSKAKKFWTMTKNQTKNSAEIAIYGTIGSSWWDESVSASQFQRDLKALGNIDNITVRINSAGGSVFDGLAIRSQLKNHKAHVTVHVDGWAASIASIIAMAGDKIVMAKGSMMMIHNPRMRGEGEADDFLEIAAFLNKIRDSLVSVYADRTGMTPEELVPLLKAETWMSADEAVTNGFADEVEQGSEAVAALMKGAVAMVNGVGLDFSKYMNAPALPEAAVASEEEEPEEENKEEGADETVKDLQELQAKYPDLFKAAMDEGVKAERARIQEIEDLTAPGNEALIAEAKTSGISAMDAFKNIVKAQKEKTVAAGKALVKDANESNIASVATGAPEDHDEGATAKAKEEELVAMIAASANQKRDRGTVTNG